MTVLREFHERVASAKLETSSSSHAEPQAATSLVGYLSSPSRVTSHNLKNLQGPEVTNVQVENQVVIFSIKIKKLTLLEHDLEPEPLNGQPTT